MDLKIYFIGLVCFSVTMFSSNSAEISPKNVLNRLRRSDSSTVKPFCSEHSPCKWGIYGKSTRKKVSYYIDNNSCVCGPSTECKYSEENFSMEAFIYRCKPNPDLITTTFAPITPNSNETETLI